MVVMFKSIPLKVILRRKKVNEKRPNLFAKLGRFVITVRIITESRSWEFALSLPYFNAGRDRASFFAHLVILVLSKKLISKTAKHNTIYSSKPLDKK